MKRYFDDAKERVTLLLEVNKEGKVYTIQQLNKKFKSDLREINKKEYLKLNKEYND